MGSQRLYASFSAVSSNVRNSGQKVKMAARSKGTLITTHRAEYVCPSMYPKYSGHFPAIKQESGKGFAQATKEHFQDCRARILTSSKGSWGCSGGKFPTIYTHEPNIVLTAMGNDRRARSETHNSQTKKVVLPHLQTDRATHLKNFSKLYQQQRDYYQDRCGKVHRVQHFKLPTEYVDYYHKMRFAQIQPTPGVASEWCRPLDSLMD